MVAASAAVLAGLGGLLPMGLGVLMGSVGVGAWFLLWSLVGVAPWLVGGWFVLRRPRLGTVVLVTSAVFAAPNVVMSLAHAFTGAMGGATSLLPFQLLMLVAGVAAWIGRPRGGWRGRGGEVPVWLLVPIVLALTLMWDGPVGGWLATLASIRSVTEVLAILVPSAVVVIGVIVLFRLRRGAVGAVLLTVAGPMLFGLLLGVVEGAQRAVSPVVPGGVAALVGSAFLVAVGTLWLLRDDVVMAPARAEEQSLPSG